MHNPDPAGSTPDPRVLAEFYSSTADAYQDLWAPELLKMSVRLLDALPLEDARAVLDAGSGVGSLLPEVARRAPQAHVVGADVAHGMITNAPPEFARAVMDATWLGFKKASFDVAILAFVLFHLPDPLLGLRQMARVLTPGAALGTITWGDDPPIPAVEIWNEVLDRYGAAPADLSLARHDFVDTESKVEALLSRAGFSTISTWINHYENAMTPDEFLAHRSGHGMSRRRLESLEPDLRVACIETTRGRLREIASGGLVHRAEVIFATALAADEKPSDG